VAKAHTRNPAAAPADWVLLPQFIAHMMRPDQFLQELAWLDGHSDQHAGQPTKSIDGNAGTRDATTTP
jgi:hypothetical protein